MTSSSSSSCFFPHEQFATEKALLDSGIRVLAKFVVYTSNKNPRWHEGTGIFIVSKSHVGNSPYSSILQAEADYQQEGPVLLNGRRNGVDFVLNEGASSASCPSLEGTRIQQQV